MLIMGVQILIGFQLHAIVQEGLAKLPASSKLCMGAALILMVGAVGLLIAPSAQHRLTENGEASLRIITTTTRLIEIALFVFAVGIALDLYVAMERIAGFRSAVAFGTASFAVALAFWYPFAPIVTGARRERAVTDEIETTSIATKIDHMLTEARVVLPGVQALLGFQLIAVLTGQFERLPPELKFMHAIGLAMMVLAMILLLAPAAFHRLAYGGEDAPLVYKVGSIFVTSALAALALGLGAGVMVAIAVLSGRQDVGALLAAVVLLVLFGLWYVWPLAARARLRSPTQSRRGSP